MPSEYPIMIPRVLTQRARLFRSFGVINSQFWSILTHCLQYSRSVICDFAVFADNFWQITTPSGWQRIELRQHLFLSKDDGCKHGEKSIIWLKEAILDDFSDFLSKFSHFHLITHLEWPPNVGFEISVRYRIRKSSDNPLE